jgi:hypothetical protein
VLLVSLGAELAAQVPKTRRADELLTRGIVRMERPPAETRDAIMPRLYEDATVRRAGVREAASAPAALPGAAGTRRSGRNRLASSGMIESSQQATPDLRR